MQGNRPGSNLSMSLKQRCDHCHCFLSTVGSFKSQPEEIVRNNTTYAIPNTKYSTYILNTSEDPCQAALVGGLADHSNDSKLPHCQSQPLPAIRKCEEFDLSTTKAVMMLSHIEMRTQDDDNNDAVYDDVDDYDDDDGDGDDDDDNGDGDGNDGDNNDVELDLVGTHLGAPHPGRFTQDHTKRVVNLACHIIVNYILFYAYVKANFYE